MREYILYIGDIMDLYERITKLDNKQLIDKYTHCRESAREHIKTLKELAKINDAIKAELKVRLSALEFDLKLAASYREKSDIAIYDYLLDLH